MPGWWEDFADLVLPAECGGCGDPRAQVCRRCREALCGAPPLRVWPERVPGGLPPVSAAAAYGDAVRALLLAHKERGALGLARVLGPALAAAVRHSVAGAMGATGAAGSGRGTAAGPSRHQGGAPWPEVVLVPVPSAGAAVRARGHDPVLRLARTAAGTLRAQGLVARSAPVLRLRGAVRDQAGLDAAARFANLAGALEVRPRCGALLGPASRTGRSAGTALVLVDDLMTTGATIAEAARALRAADVEGVLTTAQALETETARTTRSGTPGHGERDMTREPVMITAAVVAASVGPFEINRDRRKTSAIAGEAGGNSPEWR
ncbi:ComF family protein [Streptomyces sp. NPDC007088]|uniref:ComF family protein n=1 Tax=Streptomyces sp. NPDC007088 TaxID=3364773 RepID=UPI0036CAF318